MLRTPTETVELLKVPVPGVSRMVAMDKSGSVTERMSQIMMGLPPATCSIGKDRLRTMDGELIEVYSTLLLFAFIYSCCRLPT